ncbi:uncharacterized protein LOC132204119 [Neocloeon triangulifer]|uniref:uncharacterized protein LOC132204119 n=1 Tax=Neocloeon triangulifer TaxID=2078957 RepID=UPI00286EC70F|nr:uncharacterized protein LOC132204119 [Neocloeon triangulifer]
MTDEEPLSADAASGIVPISSDPFSDEEQRSDPESSQPTSLPKLGFWNDDPEQNAKPVCVLVVHYTFSGQRGDRSKGDKIDLENLETAFKSRRNCRFRRMSPGKEELYSILENKPVPGNNNLGRLQAKFNLQQDEVPEVFALFIMTHGKKDGVLDTDKDETILISDIFVKLGNDFLKDCLKLVFVSACRGEFLEMTENSEDFTDSKPIPVAVKLKTTDFKGMENLDAVKVTTEPNLPNFVIVYSTVEGSFSLRENKTGTQLVHAVCESLNNLERDTELSVFLTRVMKLVHDKLAKREFGCTPQIQIFPHKKFTISSADAATRNNGLVIPLVYDWYSTREKNICEKEAHFYWQGYNVDAKELMEFFAKKLKFRVKHHSKYCDLQSAVNGEVSTDGCVLICVIAQMTVDEETKEIFMSPKKEAKMSIASLQHNLIGPKNKRWIGKPKVCLFLHQSYVGTDSVCIFNKSSKPFELQKCGTIHSGLLSIILPCEDATAKIHEALSSANLQSGNLHLQQVFMDVLRTTADCSETQPQFWSTLQYLLDFPNPYLLLRPSFDKNANLALKHMTKENSQSQDAVDGKCSYKICLLSSPSGLGKTLLTEHLTDKLRQTNLLVTKIQVPKELHFLENFNWDLGVKEFIEAKNKGRKFSPGQEIVLLDGFDAVDFSKREPVLQMLAKIAKEKIPLWVTARPCDEQRIIEALGEFQVELLTIDKLQQEEQIELLKMHHDLDDEQCAQLLAKIEHMQAQDLLQNPSNLVQVAKLTTECPEINLSELCRYILLEKVKTEMNLREGICGERAFSWMKWKKRLAELQVIAWHHFAGKKWTPSSREDEWKINGMGIVTIAGGKAAFGNKTLAQFLLASHLCAGEGKKSSVKKVLKSEENVCKMMEEIDNKKL